MTRSSTVFSRSWARTVLCPHNVVSAIEIGNDPAAVVKAVLAALLETTGPHIVDAVFMDDGCILNAERVPTPGLVK